MLAHDSRRHAPEKPLRRRPGLAVRLRHLLNPITRALNMRSG
jgi:hypothetical protein